MPSALEIVAAASRRDHVLIAARAGYAARVAEPPDKLAAIEDAAAALGRAGVAYALIGGLAVAVRSGVPRATLDVDFAIAVGTDLDDLTRRFEDAGFRLVGRFAHSINFKHSSGEPVQLAFDERFDPMIARAEVIQFGALVVPVVTTRDLIEMKRQAASDPKRRRSMALRDQADIALLEGDVADPDEGW